MPFMRRQIKIYFGGQTTLGRSKRDYRGQRHKKYSRQVVAVGGRLESSGKSD